MNCTAMLVQSVDFFYLENNRGIAIWNNNTLVSGNFDTILKLYEDNFEINEESYS